MSEYMWAQMPKLREWTTERMAELNNMSIEEEETDKLDAEIQTTDARLKAHAQRHRSPPPAEPQFPDLDKIKAKSDADVERFMARRKAERAPQDSTKEEP
jgi:hypothetical protein